jgi:hypothetical protein
MLTATLALVGASLQPSTTLHSSKRLRTHRTPIHPTTAASIAVERHLDRSRAAAAFGA